MGTENIAVLILLAILCVLFVIRIVKMKKIHDIAILVILLLCVFVRLPIGITIPKPVLVTISLGIALVAILSYLKSKSDDLKARIESQSSSKNNTDNN